MKKNKKNIPLIIGMIIIFIGTLLPSIRIANENISFLKDNGPITIILVAIMFILYKLEKKQFIIIPSLISISIIIKFIVENISRLKQINEVYNCYAAYQYGLIVMLVGNIIILLTLIVSLLNFKLIKEKISNLKEKNKIIKDDKNKEKQPVKEKIKKTKTNVTKIKKPFIAKIKKEKKPTITKETTKDGEIKFNKIVVKCDNKETKKKKNKLNIKGKISDAILKLKLRKISHRKLSISKFNNNYRNKEKQKIITYKIPVIDIKKWTRNEICCINCGATVSTNSEYCFLCDCKMKLSESKEKIS